MQYEPVGMANTLAIHLYIKYERSTIISWSIKFTAKRSTK